MSFPKKDGANAPPRPLHFPVRPKPLATPPPPHCYECEEAPMQPLPVGSAVQMLSVFCSLECAAMFSMRCVQESKAKWCSKHFRWTNLNGDCPQCHREQAARCASSDQVERMEGGRS